jgi:hypothetical protein
MAKDSKAGIRTTFTDAIFKPKGGIASPTPVNPNGKKGK